ncbi:hypothetical protein L207DRAFT_434146 [Hyaloscypha variabilis F]|uniref:RING-type domain-containing protein n=1 Tax=Hyaloscypha variabilis (strain UAMH 11265 / GT02V1 / F) TaxID=1149755 RepID=A0A2J6RB76_HYAVF|nr:hypothetical protein L207DRAFT_434146 [Hyaloscypha variabilis F]
MAFIDATLSQSGHRLFSAYQLLDEASRTYNPLTSLYTKIKTARKGHIDFGDDSIEAIIAEPNGDLERADTLRELRAARKYKAKADEKREAERAAALAEEENEIKAQAEGTMKECACCFGDYPLNRMVHCDAEVEMHWFCRGCALRNAETEVGQSKYELCCMSMEGCDAKFTLSQRAQFLDEKTKIALERNEQEANLRLAGIENLASCPFCPYAAEYPPVEVDREFRCQAPDCEKISCRLCKLESHIPKSCEENAKETGLSVRRRIEEAMSAALIRKCNKCGTPFIKEEGCNKMRCTLKGCGNVQCYVCSKSCDYDHFDDRGRGGKPGNCPLFESVETRHDEEVSKAEKAALEQVRAEHPEYTEDDLKVKVSENVKKDDEQRRAKDPRLNPGALGGPGAAIFRGQ